MGLLARVSPSSENAILPIHETACWQNSAASSSNLAQDSLVMENVAGLMCTASRPVLEESLSRLRKGDYEWVSPVRILDAQDYGVPQRRRRVFVLGFRKGEKPPQYPATSRAKPTVWDAISDLRNACRRRTLLAKDVFVGPLETPSAYAEKLRIRSSGQVSGCRLCRHDCAVVDRFRNTRPGKTERISRFARLKKKRLHRQFEPEPQDHTGRLRPHGRYTQHRRAA